MSTVTKGPALLLGNDPGADGKQCKLQLVECTGSSGAIPQDDLPSGRTLLSFLERESD